MDSTIDDFTRHLARRAYSPSTIRAYMWGLSDLESFLQGRGMADFRQLRRRDLEDWQDSLIGRLTPSSRGLAHVAARVFLRWAGQREETGINPTAAAALERVKIPRALPRPIPADDLARIVRFLAPRRPRMRLIDLRNRALFAYLLTTAARVSEVLQVTREDLHSAIVWQKGGSEKILIIPPLAEAWVGDYLALRRDDCPWLWVTHELAEGRPMHRLSPDGVREIWKGMARKLRVPSWTTHQLRHTGATILEEANVPDLVKIAHLGHSDFSTLRRYAGVNPARRQLAVDAMGQALTQLSR
ncbi:MAG: tyrosine-type recombinase/integrase [Steroidobacteraceae bacterium]